MNYIIGYTLFFLTGKLVIVLCLSLASYKARNMLKENIQDNISEVIESKDENKDDDEQTIIITKDEIDDLIIGSILSILEIIITIGNFFILSNILSIIYACMLIAILIKTLEKRRLVLKEYFRVNAILATCVILAKKVVLKKYKKIFYEYIFSFLITPYKVLPMDGTISLFIVPIMILIIITAFDISDRINIKQAETKND